MTDLAAIWRNPRPLEAQRPVEALDVEVTLVVQSNLENEELLGRLRSLLVGGPRMGRLKGGKEGMIEYGRMPRWLREVRIEGIYEQEES